MGATGAGPDRIDAAAHVELQRRAGVEPQFHVPAEPDQRFPRRLSEVDVHRRVQLHDVVERQRELSPRHREVAVEVIAHMRADVRALRGRRSGGGQRREPAEQRRKVSERDAHRTSWLASAARYPAPTRRVPLIVAMARQHARIPPHRAQGASLAPLSAGTMDTRATHLPALDGLRAVAVFTVIVYHFGIATVPGDLGVSAFFVLSGFLITWLLLKEHAASGTVSL